MINLNVNDLLSKLTPPNCCYRILIQETSPTMSSPESKQIFFDIRSVDIRNMDTEDVKKLLSENVPTILRGCNFGPCLDRWDLDYLSEKLKEYTVVIHESNDIELDFLCKNFKYSSCKFDVLVDKLKNPSCHVYYRSACKEPHAKKPARIDEDLPILNDDLKPPGFIPYKGSELYYSSVLRIASTKIQIWTHFDLYDNVLCQTKGTKRVILISPDDTRFLYVNGDKSPVHNFENYGECIREFPLVQRAKLFRAYLEPKDAIFIPTLWWHNIKTVCKDGNGAEGSIGFNIFWKDPVIASSSIYADKDVYGNRNLIPYDAAVTNLDRALSHLNKLPKKYRKFYQYMLLERLKTRISKD